MAMQPPVPLAVGIDLGKTCIPEVSFQHQPYWHSSGIRKQWEAEQPCRKKTQHNVALLVARGGGEFPASSFFSLTFVLSANWHKNVQFDKNSWSESATTLSLPRKAEWTINTSEAKIRSCFCTWSTSKPQENILKCTHRRNHSHLL